MPIVLYSADRAYRAAVFERSPESRARIQASASPGDTLTVCDCHDGIPHLSGLGAALECPG